MLTNTRLTLWVTSQQREVGRRFQLFVGHPGGYEHGISSRDVQLGATRTARLQTFEWRLLFIATHAHKQGVSKHAHKQGVSKHALFFELFEAKRGQLNTPTHMRSQRATNAVWP